MQDDSGEGPEVYESVAVGGAPNSAPGGSRAGTPSRVAHVASTRAQVAAWYNVAAGIPQAPHKPAQADAGGHSHGPEPESNPLSVYATEQGLSREQALDALTPRFVDAVEQALKESAEKGVLPPGWVRDATTQSGRRYYERVRHEAGASIAGTRMSSPVYWLGGKYKLGTSLLPLFPSHHTYIEPFGGGGALLLSKRRAPVEVYCDYDWRLVNLMSVIQNPRTFNELHRYITLLHYSRFEYESSLLAEVDVRHLKGKPAWILKMFAERSPEKQAALLAHAEKYHDYGALTFGDVRRAAHWMMVTRQALSGQLWTPWGISLDPKHLPQDAWVAEKEDLLGVHERLQRVTIRWAHWRDTIRYYDAPGPSTFFYLDPPYVMATRKHPEAGYTHEMADSEHMELIETLLRIKAHAILSGYASPLYRALEDGGWRRFDKLWSSPQAASASGRNSKKGREKRKAKAGASAKDRKRRTGRTRRVRGGEKGVAKRIESIWVCPPLADWVSWVGPIYGWHDTYTLGDNL